MQHLHIGYRKDTELATDAFKSSATHPPSPPAPSGAGADPAPAPRGRWAERRDSRPAGAPPAPPASRASSSVRYPAPRGCSRRRVAPGWRGCGGGSSLLGGFAPFETRPVLLSPEKVSREKRFEQLLASLERNKERNKTKRNQRGKKEKKKKKPKPNSPRAHASISNGRGRFFSFGFLLKAKVRAGLQSARVEPDIHGWGGPQGSPPCGPCGGGRGAAPRGPRRGTRIVFRLRGGRGGSPPAPPHNAK